MRAAFISDLHNGPAGFHGGIQRKLTQYSEPFASEFIEKLNSREYDFAIQLGDLIEDADEETDRRNLQRGLGILQHSSVPLYHVAGNHDTGHLTAPELGRILGLLSLYYSFQAGDCRCIVLHSVLAYPGDARTIIPSAQLAWLQDELQTARGRVIVFVHHSLADQDLDGNPWFEGRPEGALIENRQEVRRMLAASGKVAAVLNGHVHWNRIDYHDGIPYITIQSAIENFRNDGTPAHSRGEISLTEDQLKIDVFGSDQMRFRYHYYEKSETAKLKIRYATAADNALLAELGARTFQHTFSGDNTPENMKAYLEASFSPEKQASELADPLSVFLIAEVDGLPVGYARLKEGNHGEGKTGLRPVEIVRIYARKEWIGNGVGSRLMQACLKEAEKRGCDMIWLAVWERNHRAIAFYRKWGFAEVGTQSFRLGDDLQNDLVLQRVVKI